MKKDDRDSWEKIEENFRKIERKFKIIFVLLLIALALRIAVLVLQWQ